MLFPRGSTGVSWHVGVGKLVPLHMGLSTGFISILTTLTSSELGQLPRGQSGNHVNAFCDLTLEVIQC